MYKQYNMYYYINVKTFSKNREKGKNNMKKKKQTLLKLISSFAIIGMSITGIYAASYSYTQSDTVSSSVGFSKSKMLSYHIIVVEIQDGIDSWGTVSTNGLKATYISSTMTIPSDPYMNTTGTISMTNYNYKTANAKKTFKYKFDGSKVVGNY